MTQSEARPLSTLADRDPHRPRFHFAAPGGWLNDPNGLSQWGGTYHLFYQYNPDSAVHSSIHWGHATSTDLVRWTDEPIALTPGNGPDADGCWSGVLLDDGGTPTIVYTGLNGEDQLPCIATGSADLRTWRKDPGNPVIPKPPTDRALTGFRDHCVWREDGRWHQLIGSGFVGVGGTALRYTSDDLRSWEYEGPILIGDATSTEPIWTGTMWECVDLFGLDGTDILLFSAWDEGVTHYPAYFTGRYADGRFTPSATRVLDYGLRYFYAPQTMRDDSGRRLMFGWLQEGRSEAAAVAAGWSGVMSLPRLVTVDADGLLRQQPAPEVAALRRDHVSVASTDLSPGETVRLAAVHGDQLDLETRLFLDEGATVEVALRCTPDGAERTVLVIDRPSGEIRLDRTGSSQDPDVDISHRSGPLPIGDDGLVELRVLVDHSALEIFANGRALTARIYPTRSDAAGVELTATGASARVEALDAWAMADSWAGPRPPHP